MASITFPKPNESLSYVTITDSFANDNTLDIWIKFTSHLKEDELLLITKDSNSLSQTELDKYNSIKKQLYMSLLFRKYKVQECTKVEHDLVLDYMHNSLTSFVRDRMTEDEQRKALVFLLSKSKEELEEYIQSREDKYDELSAYAAYVLFMAKETLYDIKQEELNEAREKDRIKELSKTLKD